MRCHRPPHVNRRCSSDFLRGNSTVFAVVAVWGTVCVGTTAMEGRLGCVGGMRHAESLQLSSPSISSAAFDGADASAECCETAAGTEAGAVAATAAAALSWACPSALDAVDGEVTSSDSLADVTGGIPVSFVSTAAAFAGDSAVSVCAAVANVAEATAAVPVGVDESQGGGGVYPGRTACNALCTAGGTTGNDVALPGPSVMRFSDEWALLFPSATSRNHVVNTFMSSDERGAAADVSAFERHFGLLSPSSTLMSPCATVTHRESSWKTSASRPPRLQSCVADGAFCDEMPSL
jgi:hypothetical protein